jgi:hypothetical protein
MMGLTWYILGLLTTGSLIFLWKFSQHYAFKWHTWSGFVFGIVLILFSIAWGVGAVLEGVPRAGSMGILLFGLPGIILVTVTLRYSTNRLEKRQVSHVKEKVEVTKTPPISLKTVQPTTSKKSGWWSLLPYGAYVSLVIAFIFGIITGGEDYESMIKAKYTDLVLEKIHDDPVVFQVGEKVNGQGEYILIQEGQGYGGPFVFAIRIKDDAKIHEVFPLADKETPAFIKKIKETNYRNQFIGRGIADNFIVGDDIDGVSGATVTTMAATEAVRNGAHIAAVEYFKLEPSWGKTQWKFGLDEVLIMIIFILAFIPQIHRPPYKYIYMAVSIGVVGFYLNAAVSIGNLSGLLMGYIPSADDHLIWWILVIGTIATIILVGKNVYCYKICPFYGVQFLLNKISGNRFNPSPALLRQARPVANGLLWLALMLIFLSQLPSAGAFEPFAMMFSLEGVGIQWYILPLAIIGSFFMSSFWCRFFCPAGSAFSILLKARKKVVTLLASK